MRFHPTMRWRDYQDPFEEVARREESQRRPVAALPEPAPHDRYWRMARRAAAVAEWKRVLKGLA